MACLPIATLACQFEERAVSVTLVLFHCRSYAAEKRQAALGSSMSTGFSKFACACVVVRRRNDRPRARSLIDNGRGRERETRALGTAQHGDEMTELC